MTQPAKVQEPSMEEILASIRRIIADDEAKPPAAEEPADLPPPPAKLEKLVAAPPPTKDVPPSKIPPAVAAARAATPARPPAPPPTAPPPPAPAANHNQDDVDALLAGLDETTTPKEILSTRPNDEVHEMTDDMAVPAPPQASFQRVGPHDDLEFAEASASRAAHRPPAYDPPAVSTAILSQSTVAAVESAFNTLATTVLSNHARTLEDLVKDMLRPMLKSWLDNNLPGLVERIVKAEIERVSRGR